MKKKKFKKKPKTEEQVLDVWAESGEAFNPKKKLYRSPKELKEDVEEIICNNGSTWVKKEFFLTECEEVGISEESIKYLFDEDFIVEEVDARTIPYISTKEIKEAEEEIARLIYWHTNVKVLKRHPLSKITEIIARAEKREKIILANEQKMAIIKAINSPITVITGVAGAGKTTIDKIIAEVFKELGEAMITCNLAPTGKASKRMEEALEQKAETVDKNLLNGRYITEQAMFVDEASFLDTKNLARLLRKAVRCTHIIFQGDIYQLSSVGCGMVLRDLIDSGMVTVQKLNKSFRVDKDAINIQRNVQLIRDYDASKMQTTKEYLEDGTKVTVVSGIKNKFTQGDDFHIYADTPANELFDKLLDCYEEKVNKYGRENVCVLIPFRNKNKGKVTSEGFNEAIEKKLFGETGYHVGSTVMQLVNAPYAQNGSIGTVTAMTASQMTVKFSEKDEHIYTSNEVKKQLTLAYGMSVHKSQGSEYNCVIVVTLNEHKKMLNRNLIYTAITRAKKEVNYFFDSECLHNALSKEASALRVTMLREKLEAVCKAKAV